MFGAIIIRVLLVCDIYIVRLVSDSIFYHFTGWFRSILPKSALRVEEEAWNAYPYTKTIFRCPFIEKFSITIETVYHQDGGTQENVFGLSQGQLGQRVVGKFEFHLQHSIEKLYPGQSHQSDIKVEQEVLGLTFKLSATTFHHEASSYL